MSTTSPTSAPESATGATSFFRGSALGFFSPPPLSAAPLPPPPAAASAMGFSFNLGGAAGAGAGAGAGEDAGAFAFDALPLGAVGGSGGVSAPAAMALTSWSSSPRLAS